MNNKESNYKKKNQSKERKLEKGGVTSVFLSDISGRSRMRRQSCLWARIEVAEASALSSSAGLGKPDRKNLLPQ